MNRDEQLGRENQIFLVFAPQLLIPILSSPDGDAEGIPPVRRALVRKCADGAGDAHAQEQNTTGDRRPDHGGFHRRQQ